MPAYATFAAVTVLAVTGIVALASASTRAIAAAAADGHPRFTPGLLAGNVLATHGVTGVVLVGAAWYADIPSTALGIAGIAPTELVTGCLVGAALAAGNEAAQRTVGRLGIEHDETLRGLLTPTSAAGWVVLLGLALPVVAVVEELLFRAAVIGVIGTGFGLPVWGLAVVSSIAFGLGHGLQGAGGVVVTAALGFVLAATFIVTGSLAAVVIAHYVVNAVEFLAHPAG